METEPLITMQHPAQDPADMLKENQALRARLEEAEALLGAVQDTPERKRTDAALHLSEIRYRRLFEAAHDGILILDPDTRKIVDANPFMTALIGYPHEQLIGLELYEIGFLADAQASRDMFKKLKATRQVRYENLPLQARQGGTRDVEVVANLYDEGGHIVVQCNVRDITERKAAETRNAQLAALVESSDHAILSVDLDDRIMTWNPGASALFGYSEDEAVGRNVEELTVPEHLIEQRRKSFEDVIAGRVAITRDTERRCKNGTLVPVEVNASPMFSTGGGVIGISAIISDITGRKAAEAALRERENELSRANRIAGMGSFKVEVRDGHFVADRSPEYLAVHGLTPQDRGNSHESWMRRLHPEDREKADRRFRECLADGRKFYESEYRIIRQNDSATRWIKVLAEIERDASGAPLRIFGTHLDITESRLHEVALRTSEIRYRRLFEAAHDGILILDPLTRKIVDANPFMTALLGYRHDELIGMELYEIGFLADAQASRDMFQELTATRQVRYEDLPLRNQQGGLRDVEVVANLYDENGHSVVQCNVRDITERRRAEAELRERRNFLDGIFKVLPGVLYIFDLDENRVVFSNKRVVGPTYSSEEIAAMGGDFVGNLMHADDQPRFQDYIARIRMLDPGTMATFEYRMKDKAGEWHWYLNTDTVFLRDENGVARQFIGVALEITDRKLAEFALQESEVRSRRDADEIASIYANAPIGLCIFDKELRYQRINAQLAEINGIPAEAHIGKTVREIVPDVADECERIAARVFATGEPVVGSEISGMTQAKPGKLRHWMSQWVPIKDASGVVTGISVVAEEITERKNAEAALRESEAFSWAVFEASPDCVKIFDAAGTLLRMNVNGQSCMEIDEFDTVCGLRWPVLWPQEERAKVDAALAEALAGRVGRFTGLCPTMKGTLKWWDVSVTSIPGTGGGPRRLMASSRDVTERKRQEEHIRLLMGEVNHRSKNMLSLVQAIAKRTVATHPKDFIARFGERVRALAASQDLLVKSEWRAVSLGELVHAQLAHFDDAHDSRITLDGPQLAIKASASQALGMALHELATNAAKYGALSNTSGRVIISWSLPAGKARFTMSWIESGGPPVTKPTSLGFGSTVTGNMIKMSLDGEVEVDFAPTGLIWRINCPVEGLLEDSAPAASRPNGAAVKEDPAQATGRRRVLVVEDEPLIAMDIARTLSEAGYDVVGPASSVAQALALIARSGCDVAVLDTNLGAETAEPVARELIRRGTPFIASSGYAREQQPEIMRTVPLLGKPLKPGMLVAEIERFLGR